MFFQRFAAYLGFGLAALAFVIVQGFALEHQLVIHALTR